jgi:hypothetical protein
MLHDLVTAGDILSMIPIPLGHGSTETLRSLAGGTGRVE